MAQVTGSYTLHVDAPPQPLTLSPASGALPNQTVGQPAAGTVTISGGKAPYSLVSATGLPPGVNAALNNIWIVLQGSPTAPGDFTPQYVVADSQP